MSTHTWNTKTAKTWLRQYALNRRRSLSIAERARRSQRINAFLKNHPALERAQTMAVFLSFGSEPSLNELIQWGWKKKKTILIPDTRGGFARPSFVRYDEGDSLKTTSYGPQELRHPKSPYPLDKIQVILVSGLLFDKRGYRVGFGGGVYDRLLAKTKSAKKIGVFFSTQEVLSLPIGTRDVSLNMVVTENNIMEITV